MYKKFMDEQELDFLLVNSTNEYLVEYTPLNENSRYKLTGFTGSTGDALVTRDRIFLFVDGRYHIQADLEVNKEKVTVIKLQTGEKFLDKISKFIPPKEVLGIFSKKNSQENIEYIKSQNIKIKLLDYDPLDDDSYYNKENIVEVEGISAAEKIKNLYKTMILTNLEEVSYLLNLRDFSTNYSSKIKGKAIVSSGNVILTDKIEDFVKTHNGKIHVDKSGMNAYDYNIIGNKAKNFTSPIKLMKSVKTENEINHYKTAFNRTDKTLKEIREYIEQCNNLSEYEISNKLEQEFIKNGAKNLSFKSIVALDKNSALAHYSKCSKTERVKDQSLILIDCGAYYEQGLATDITRVFVKGNPTKLQIKVYTVVLKMFLNAFNYSNETIYGFDVDNLARKIYENNKIKGFVFNHGLGHGIGINVHEYPPNLSNNEVAKVKILDNMCFTIEPGLYNKEYFGIRLENSCYMKNKKIHSFTNMNFEKKLIDLKLLSKQEKIWLDEFEVI